jgi:hypothetical protein
MTIDVSISKFMPIGRRKFFQQYQLVRRLPGFCSLVGTAQKSTSLRV